MKRFRFSMSRLLAYRQQRKKLSEVELANSTENLEAARQERVLQFQLLKELLTQQDDFQRINPSVRLSHQAKIESQRQRMELAMEAEKVAYQEWLEVQEKSRRAIVEYESLEQIRNEQLSTHLKEQKKQEFVEQAEGYLRNWPRIQESKSHE